jgi:SAM-dependent methyltransferase
MNQQLERDILQWDVKSWAKALQYWERKIDFSTTSKALELGGREGGLSLWLALKGISTVCSDLSCAKKTAEPLHKRYGVSQSIQYQDIDATHIPYENHFDIIVFKSIIGGIGSSNNKQAQDNVFREIYKALKPGGRLLFAENLVASPVHRKLRKRFVKWGESWRYITTSELNVFLRDFDSVEIHSSGVLGTFGRTEKQRNVLSALDNILFNHLCKDSWKYIAYGIATKPE